MSIEFTINGKPYSVKCADLPADITLNTFIREHAQLFGTKFYCQEGGCGCCTITIRSTHPVSNRLTSRGVVSCLTLLNTCHGYDVVTIEGLGNRQTGYHSLQKRLAQLNGTQCGYCSPGMIMNMYSLLESKNGLIGAEDVENSFGGNLCRCTGYRPILDTMKSFATSSECDLSNQQQDIEDLKLCPKVGQMCNRKCHLPKRLKAEDQRIWHHPVNLAELYNILRNMQGMSNMLVAGNTAHGVYRRDPDIEVFIDVNHVRELRSYDIGDVIELGGNITLTELIEIMKEASTLNGYEYLSETLSHLDLVASVQIRNAGTIAGNLMIKHKHNEFISDIFVMLLTIGARVVISNYSGDNHETTLVDFLELDMSHQVITRIILPQLDKRTTIYGAYKILPRAQHSHAFVNAGFLFSVSENQISSSRICYNGINQYFNESTATVDFFKGRKLFDPETLQQAIEILDAEFLPDWVLPAPSPEYRKKLALGLFYKFYIREAPSGLVKEEYRTGGYLLDRPLSSGTQNFDTRKDRWPVNKPVQKLEALWQCAGEAVYSNDIPHMRDEVWAAFVPATVVHARLADIDPSEALAMSGVVAFYTAKDIPGTNSFVSVGSFAIVENEELFCAEIVKYHSQPVGMILAKTNELAQIAATKVKIWYEHTPNRRSPKPTMKDIMQVPDSPEHENSDDEFVNVDFDECTAEINSDKTARIRGHLELGGQFHFSIESHTTVSIPHEGGLLLYSATHFIDLLQTSIMNALRIPENKVDIIVQRLGGSFGCKISRSNHVAVGAALGSWLSNRPVRFVQSIENNMRISGKRFACSSNYSVSANDEGKIESLQLTFYEDMGHTLNESPTKTLAIPTVSNCYEKTSTWMVSGNDVLTDAPSNTWCRAPGTLEGMAMIENIMEHIARTVKRDPVDVRLANIPQNSEMRRLLPDFIKSTEYRERRRDIDALNKINRWRKRGIAISLMRYPVLYFGQIAAAVAIYHFDGTVAISHGGIEMGQGLNTKAAQVAAYTLGISLEMVSVKATNSFEGANCIMTAASSASETVCYAVRKACQHLLDRMKPVRDKMPDVTWPELVKQAHQENINLVSHQIHKKGDLAEYDVWGLACTEMEVDILTGKSQITRVDIVEDTGESLSPLIDVGQIEGAFVHALGYWLSEKLVYDRQTGELKTHNSWEYKIPGAKDIPIDFRVTLLQKTPNSKGFLQSKATGEMAICLSVSTVFALRHALDSARNDVGMDEWYHLGAPTTIEDVLLAAAYSKTDLKL